MLLAPVDEEPAGEAPDLPPVDEEMERELMDEKKWNHQLRSKFRHPMSQPVTSGDIMDSPICRINLGATSVSELVGEKQACVTITKPARHTRHPMRLLLPEDRGRCSNGHSPGGHRHSVQTDGCHSS